MEYEDATDIASIEMPMEPCGSRGWPRSPVAMRAFTDGSEQK
jgi:hypothetical protein